MMKKNIDDAYMHNKRQQRQTIRTTCTQARVWVEQPTSLSKSRQSPHNVILEVIYPLLEIYYMYNFDLVIFLTSK